MPGSKSLRYAREMIAPGAPTTVSRSRATANNTMARQFSVVQPPLPRSTTASLLAGRRVQRFKGSGSLNGDDDCNESMSGRFGIGVAHRPSPLAIAPRPSRITP